MLPLCLILGYIKVHLFINLFISTEYGQESTQKNTCPVKDGEEKYVKAWKLVPVNYFPVASMAGVLDAIAVRDKIIRELQVCFFSVHFIISCSDGIVDIENESEKANLLEIGWTVVVINHVRSNLGFRMISILLR